MLRDLSLTLRQEPESQLPLTRHEECVKITDVLDLSKGQTRTENETKKHATQINVVVYPLPSFNLGSFSLFTLILNERKIQLEMKDRGNQTGYHRWLLWPPMNACLHDFLFEFSDNSDLIACTVITTEDK